VIPNKIFSGSQFVLFSIDVYEMFETYYVEFKYGVD